MWLPDRLVAEVNDKVRAFYVDWQTCRYWNASRKKGEPIIFSGWYYAHGGHEHGPFKSKSSAYRDAWFRAVCNQEPPTLTGRNTEADDERERARIRATRRAAAKREARAYA
jgi:hypothetical protein